MLTTSGPSFLLLTPGSMVTFLPSACLTLLTLQRHIRDLRWALLSSHVVFCVNSDRTHSFQIRLLKGPFLLSLRVIIAVILLGSEVTNRITGIVQIGECILLSRFFFSNETLPTFFITGIIRYALNRTINFVSCNNFMNLLATPPKAPG